MEKNIGAETWKIVVEGAKRNKHVILCCGYPERSYGFSMYASRNDPRAKNNFYDIVDGELCFRCGKKHWKTYFEWIFDEELKNLNYPLGAYRPVCTECFEKLN